MINREATIRWKGYDPNNLKPRSNRRVWANCDDCGKGRWVVFQAYRSLCRSCVMKGKTPTEETRKKISKNSGNRKGCHHTKKTIKKMSESSKGIKHSKESKLKMSKSRMGHKVSKETKQKISQFNMGREVSKETRKKLSESHKGYIMSQEQKDKISKGNKGKIISEKTREKMSNFQKGKIISKETREKISKANSGENNFHWEGGKSFEIYPIEFNRSLKRNVRELYNNCDFFSGLNYKYFENKNLSIHHIDYDKDNSNVNNFIPLCSKHHAQTNNNRWFWKKLIKNVQEIDKLYY